MNNETNKTADALVLDAVLERPFVFRFHRQKYSIYPPTLGKSLMISSELADLGIDAQLLAQSPITETLRLASTCAPKVARLIAISVCRTREELYDSNHFLALVDDFQEMEKEDAASLLHYILTQDVTAELQRHFQLDREFENLRKCERAKDHADNSLTFCGCSIWGSLIDWAAERYGWTYEYIVWGISYTALRMLQADQVRQVYLTEEERKKIHLPRPGDEVLRVEDMSVEELKNKLNIK